MERLAHRDDKGWYIVGENGDRLRGAHVDRLAAYEGTGLEPKDINDFTERRKKAVKLGGLVRQYGIDRLCELVEAEKDGRLVALPCKVGDTVYIPNYASIAIPLRVQGISVTATGRTILHFGGFPIKSEWGDEVGETIFLTREEAEAALGLRKGEGDG